MKEKELTQQESLDLITKVIQDTREQTERKAGTPFLIWGYSTVIISILGWYLVNLTHNGAWFLIWFALPAIALPFHLRYNKQSNKGFSTALDRMIGWVWGSLGFTAFIIASVNPIAYYLFHYEETVVLNIFFMMALLMSLGTTITGGIIRSKIVSVAGIAGILCSISFLFIESIDVSLWFGLLFFIMMVIPGHLLNYKTHKAHV